MSGALPRISIVTPCFNQAAYIAQTIESVLDQGYPELEYLIVDGGSTDGSAEIISRYADRLAWWTTEPDEGQVHALNKGFARATGEVLAFINSDDYYLPGAFDAIAKRWAAQPFDFCAGACRHVDESGETLLVSAGTASSLTDFLDLDRYKRDYLTQPEVFWSARAFRALGGFDESYHLAFDYEYWVRAAAAGLGFCHIDRELACFRRHGAQKTQGSMDGVCEDVRVVETAIAAVDLPPTDRTRVRAGLRHYRSWAQYEAAKAALGERRYGEAAAAFGRALGESPGYTLGRTARRLVGRTDGL